MGKIQWDISMKRIALTISIALTLLMSASSSAQSHPLYTTVIVQYAAKSDRPYLSDIVIGTSTGEAEWYRDEVCHDPESLSTGITLVQTATMRKFADILQEDGVRNKFLSADTPKTEPTLDLVLGLGKRYTVVAISAKNSVAILTKLKGSVANYPSLVKELSSLEDSMDTFLKNHHD